MPLAEQSKQQQLFSLAAVANIRFLCNLLQQLLNSLLSLFGLCAIHKLRETNTHEAETKCTYHMKLVTNTDINVNPHKDIQH